MKYRHPHDETTIIDNTEIQPELTSNSGPVLFMPFISSKGVDGEVITFNDYGRTIKDYGTPDFNKHGQAYLQVLNWLQNKGVVRGIRLTADDATYSNVVVIATVTVKSVQKTNEAGQPLYTDSLGHEVTEPSGNTPISIKKATIKITGESLSSLSSKDKATVIDKMKSLGSNSGGTTKVPLFTCLCKGKGSYGDMYRIRMTSDLMADKSTSFRNYTFELFENSNGLKRIEDPLTASLYPSAMDSYKRSCFIDDIIKDNLYPVILFSNPEAHGKIVEALKPIFEQDKKQIEPESVDFLFGLDVTGKNYENIDLDVEGLNLSALEGIQLSSGSDGKFAMSNDERDTAIYAMYKNCYNGTVDPQVFNKKKFPADIMLDANFPLEVKKAMQMCRTKRNDCPLILDGGIMSTLTAAKSWRKSEMPVDDYTTAVYFQHFSTKDQYSGKEITVTVPYLISIMLPQHFINVGNHKPLAGTNYPIRDIIIEGTLKPSILEPEDKSEFYDMRLNYLEEDVNFVNFGTQLTSQLKESQLSNLNNIYVLYEMKHVIENLVPRFRYEFTESDDDMANFNRMANQALQTFQDYKCKAVKVNISQTPYEKQRKILNTELKIFFKSFNERNDIRMIIER